jgi:hypothetical protein
LAKKPYVSIFDFQKASELKKGQGQGAQFRNFDTHTTRQQRSSGGQ